MITKINPRMRIRHCNNYDIDYHVVDSYEEIDGFRVGLIPYHRRLSQSYDFVESFINKKDFSNWTEITTEQRVDENNKKWLNRVYETGAKETKFEI